MQVGKKNLQSSRLPRIPKTSDSISGYLANTRASGKEGIDNKDVELSTGFTGGR